MDAEICDFFVAVWCEKLDWESCQKYARFHFHVNFLLLSNLVNRKKDLQEIFDYVISKTVCKLPG